MKRTTILLLIGVFVIDTGHGYGGLDLGGDIGPDGIGISGLSWLIVPGIGTFYGTGDVGLGFKHGLQLGEQIGFKHGGKSGVPGVSGVSTPDLGVTVPGLGNTVPGLGVTVPGLGVTVPGLGVTVPGLGVTVPGLGDTKAGLGVSLPNLGITSPSPAAETNSEPEPETETPSPGPTSTPETITLETTPAGQTCNQTECEIDCERKGHIAKLAQCEPNEQTGDCRCGGGSCLPDACYERCASDDYQRGYCKNTTVTGSNCYCFGCRQPYCYNACRQDGWPKGFCKFYGQFDDRQNQILICTCFGVQRDKPYPITTAATTASTLDILANELVSSKSTT